MSFRVRVRFGFGIGNLIGGAVGTVESALARRLIITQLPPVTGVVVSTHGCRQWRASPSTHNSYC